MRLLTVEQINIDWLKSANLEELKNAMRSGGTVLGAVNALLQTPEGKKIAYEMMNDPDYVPFSQRQPDADEAAQIAADQAEAERQAAESEAQRQADELAAQQQPPTDAVVSTPEPPKVEEKKKYTIDYQVTDEDSGRAIGRATHFEAFGTEVEALRAFVEKLKEAHINAVRYAERIKTNRFKQSAASLQATESSVAAKNAQAESDRLAAEAAKEQDPAKMQEAVRKAADAQREADIARKANIEHGRIIAQTWMEDHKHDFLPCDASTSIMGQYLKDNNLVLSYDNLQKAFEAVKHQLPPVPTERQQVAATDVATSAVTVDNSQATAVATAAASSTTIPSTAAAAAAPETPTSQSSVAPPASTTTAQESTPAAPNKAPAARKPAVNGSLQPGQLSAQRPGASTSTQQDTAVTRAQLLREIGKMDPAIYRKKLATDKSFRERLIAAGIQVVGHRS